MYADGRGVPQDYAEALRWYRLATEQGSREAQTNLGLMYAKGEGVPVDYIQAHAWFLLADSDQLKNLTAKLLTETQLAQARKLSQEFMGHVDTP